MCTNNIQEHHIMMEEDSQLEGITTLIKELRKDKTKYTQKEIIKIAEDELDNLNLPGQPLKVWAEFFQLVDYKEKKYNSLYVSLLQRYVECEQERNAKTKNSDGSIFDYHKKSKRINSCSDNLEFVKNTNNEMKLHQAHFCRFKYCPICARNARVKRVQETTKVVERVKEKEKYNQNSFIFFTVSPKNVCTADELNESLKKLGKSLKGVFHNNQRIEKSQRGYISALECTYNKKQNTYNQHLHILMFMRKGYRRDMKAIEKCINKDTRKMEEKSAYIKRDEWKSAFCDVLGLDDSNLRVHVQTLKIKNKDDLEEIKNATDEKEKKEIQKKAFDRVIFETTKYTVKSDDFITGDLERDVKVFDTYSKAFFNMTVFSMGGVFRDAQIEINKEERNEKEDAENNFMERKERYVNLIDSLDMEKKEILEKLNSEKCDLDLSDDEKEFLIECLKKESLISANFELGEKDYIVEKNMSRHAMDLKIEKDDFEKLSRRKGSIRHLKNYYYELKGYGKEKLFEKYFDYDGRYFDEEFCDLIINYNENEYDGIYFEVRKSVLELRKEIKERNKKEKNKDSNEKIKCEKEIIEVEKDEKENEVKEDLFVFEFAKSNNEKQLHLDLGIPFID